MATTTNYSWTTPDDTALVKDGASAIRSLGTSIDTTTKNLNPSTTLGDIEYRSSTANTNTRLGIGSTGQVLTVAAGVPSWANGFSNPLTTTGDTIYSSSGSTPARLGIGTTGQVLTVASGIPSWATIPSSAPKSASATIANAESTTSSSYTNLTTAGPAVTLTTGTKVMVIVSGWLYGTNTYTHRRMSFAISGATTTAAADENGLDMYIDDTQGNNYAPQVSFVSYQTVTAGSNTFTAKYRQQGGSTASFANRSITVIDLGS